MDPSYNNTFGAGNPGDIVLTGANGKTGASKKKWAIIFAVLVLVAVIAGLIGFFFMKKSSKAVTLESYINYIMNGDENTKYDGPKYYVDNSNYIARSLYDDDDESKASFAKAKSILEEVSKKDESLDKEALEDQIEYLKIYIIYRGIGLNDESIVNTYKDGGADAVNNVYKTQINEVNKFRNQTTNIFVINALNYVENTVSILDILKESGCEINDLEGISDCVVSQDRKQEYSTLGIKKTTAFGMMEDAVYSSIPDYINGVFSLEKKNEE